MGTCSSTDSANVIESTTPETPHAATGSSRTTRNSTGHVPSGLHPQGEGRPTQRSLLFRLRRSSNENQLQRRHEHEIREIEQLQFELAAMEALFQSMLGQAFREQMGVAVANNEHNGGPPPASTDSLRQLVTIAVEAKDLVEETNRECVICFNDNHIGDRVVRLTCGHLFHHDCISRWIAKHCTCPVCRYELPTDDPLYERGRIERMAMRRPRLRRDELERMQPLELHELAFNRLNLSGHQDVLTDRADLIDRIVNSGKVDMVASPDPIEYKLSDLKDMGVSKLRNAMSDAGVIFDPVDVVEKDDMINMFIKSGRATIVPEEVISCCCSSKSSCICCKLEEEDENLSAKEERTLDILERK